MIERAIELTAKVWDKNMEMLADRGLGVWVVPRHVQGIRRTKPGMYRSTLTLVLHGGAEIELLGFECRASIDEADEIISQIWPPEKPMPSGGPFR